VGLLQLTIITALLLKLTAHIWINESGRETNQAPCQITIFVLPEFPPPPFSILRALGLILAL
jgi:hypothetical protein